jgi:NADH dehydrogenase FAD-containing subunit
MTEQVVIVGGGFGGLEAAFSLKGLLGHSADITLVNRDQQHCFIPSIHLIVSGKTTPRQICIPLNVVLGAAGIRFIQDEILSVDAGSREVISAGGRLAYDYLLLSSGATNNFFDIPGAERFSCRFRTAEDADQIRVLLLKLLHGEEAGRIVLAGAGTEGVEVIGEVLDLIRSEGLGEELAAGAITIELVEGKGTLLPSFPLAVQQCAEGYLRQQGVRLIPGDRIAEVKQDRVVLTSGAQLAASLLIWSGGIQPSKLIRDLPFDKDPWGWLKVNDRLQVPADERIFAIGDAVSISTEDGPLTLQRLAYHAQDQARVAALNISAALSGGRPVSYEPRSRPQLISMGGDMGIFTLGDRVSSGPWVVSLKKAIERKHLMTYLTKPLSSALWSRVPGTAFLQRLRTRFL